MRHWLFKSEPDCYSFTDLENAPGQTTSWDGVRNYQARNFMRDDMKKGDLGFFYHSGKNPEIAGIVEIVREGHPDITAQDPEAGHFDPKATPGDPRWYMVDVKPSNLVQFAKMGSIYMENIMGRKNPRVAIVNIGIEEEKGNALVKQTYPLLKECKDINFIGSIEAREIPNGYADVIVCEAFVGNVILKMYEGVAGALMGKVKETMMSSLKTKIGALLIKKDLKKTLKAFDASAYGGAPMLGLKGLVVKSHGSSNAKEIKQSVLQCIAFKQQNISGKIAETITIDKKPTAGSEEKPAAE